LTTGGLIEALYSQPVDATNSNRKPRELWEALHS